MLNDLKRDYVVNNKGKRVMLILLIYRLGNKVFYSTYPKLVRKILLSFLGIINQLFVFYPFKIEIPFSCKIGAGFRIVHQHGIVLNGSTKIGKNCTIYHQVTIGMNELSLDKKAPIIGDDVFIGCGAKIIGHINIGDNARIGANAVVITDLEQGDTAICRQEVLIKKSTQTVS